MKIRILLTFAIVSFIAMGHSMSKIDLGYFDIIKNTFPNAKWEVGYFNIEDLENKKDVSNRFGLTLVDFFEFS